MDSGVALITLNAGISSRKGRPWYYQQNKTSIFKELFQAVKESLFPIALGFIRIFLLSELDYQEHASEYGIHWNFYTTIAIVNLLIVFLRNADHALPIAFATLIGYELVIKEYNLEQFIFFAPRTDFISANREGLFSLVGYISMQMIGIGIGNIFYKSVMTQDEIKLLKAGKPIEKTSKVHD